MCYLTHDTLLGWALVMGSSYSNWAFIESSITGIATIGWIKANDQQLNTHRQRATAEPSTLHSCLKFRISRGGGRRTCKHVIAHHGVVLECPKDMSVLRTVAL